MGYLGLLCLTLAASAGACKAINRAEAPLSVTTAAPPAGLNLVVILALDPEDPDGHNDPDHAEPADCPTHRVGSTVCLGSIDHLVVPLGHDRLLGGLLRR